MEVTEVPDLVVQFHNDLKQLYNSDKFCDLHIRVCGTILRAHRVIISKRNASLAAIISNEWKRGTLKTSINLDNAGILNLKAFTNLIKFLYTCELDEKDINLDLLIVAHTYKDTSLKEIYEKHLCKILNQENAVESLISAVKYNCQKLQEVASEFVAKNYSHLSAQMNFESLLQNKEAACLAFQAFQNMMKIIDEDAGQFVHTFNLKPSLTDIVRSEVFYIRNLPWVIELNPQKDENETKFWIILECTYNKPFACCVSWKVSLVSSLSCEYHKVFSYEKLSYTSTAKKRYGWNMPWTDIINLEKGYFNNDFICIQVEIKVSQVEKQLVDGEPEPKRAKLDVSSNK